MALSRVTDRAWVNRVRVSCHIATWRAVATASAASTSVATVAATARESRARSTHSPAPHTSATSSPIAGR